MSEVVLMLAGAVIGAVIGTILGVVVNDWRLKEQQKRKAKSILTGVTESLRFNSDRNEQIWDQIRNKNQIPNYQLDTLTLKEWLFIAHEHLPEKLNKELHWHWFQLDHINQKLAIARNEVKSIKEGNEAHLAFIKKIMELLEHNKGTMEGGYKLADRVTQEKDKL